jgi:hypothetical protein
MCGVFPFSQFYYGQAKQALELREHRASMDQMPPLVLMGRIGTGRQRLEVTRWIRESPEPLPVKQWTTMANTLIQSLVRPSLFCNTKDRPRIRSVVPTRKSRKAKNLQEIDMLFAWSFTGFDVNLCELC